MGKLDEMFKNKNAREAQSRESMTSQQRAAHEMRMRTMMQGRQMAFKHVRERVETMTPEWCRMLSAWILPVWYEKVWFKLLAAMLWLTQIQWTILSWIGLLPVLRRARQILWRGGHVAKIGQGPSEFVVRINIFKWFKLKYKCDMDVRNGHVSEVWVAGD